MATEESQSRFMMCLGAFPSIVNERTKMLDKKVALLGAHVNGAVYHSIHGAAMTCHGPVDLISDVITAVGRTIHPESARARR